MRTVKCVDSMVLLARALLDGSLGILALMTVVLYIVTISLQSAAARDAQETRGDRNAL